MPFCSAVKFRQTARIPENCFWATIGSLCMAERTVDRFNGSSIEGSRRLGHFFCVVTGRPSRDHFSKPPSSRRTS